MVVVIGQEERKLPKPTLTRYSDPLLAAEPITISDWFQTPPEPFPLAPIPPPSSPITSYASKRLIRCCYVLVGHASVLYLFIPTEASFVVEQGCTMSLKVRISM